MKNVVRSVKNRIVNATANIVDKVVRKYFEARTLLAAPTAEGYVDSGVKILIAVVIGALLLAGLYALFNTTIMPTVTQKVQGLFNYNG
ncbi:MAG: hypothetical protein IJJ85_07705 [Clostridia bacterium]|nr:hypothetical protein [Clostridia bacterium]